MLSVKTILMPTDFSPYADAAFQMAHSLARDYGARLVVLHAYEPIATVAYGELDMGLASEEAERAMLNHKLCQVQIPGSNVEIEHELREGFAADAILQAAKDFHADLIVVGTHGRTGLPRFLMGSVAEEVVRKAACPVLTVKAHQQMDAEEKVAAMCGAGI